jgi:hypothetical protein
MVTKTEYDWLHGTVNGILVVHVFGGNYDNGNDETWRVWL